MTAGGGFSGYATYVNFDDGREIPFVLSMIVCSFIGSRLAPYVPGRQLRRIFAIVLLLLGAMIVVREAGKLSGSLGL